jgi:protein involved in polysaccharide export with SLBB domain
LGAAALLSGCATMPSPRNTADAQYQVAQQQGQEREIGRCVRPPVPLAISGLRQVAPEQYAAVADLIAPGDRLNLQVAGDKDQLTGTYVVSPTGMLLIGGAVEVNAMGRSRSAVAYDLRQKLVQGGYIRNLPDNVRLQLAQASHVNLSVEGAVFFPGQVTAGERGELVAANVYNHPANGDNNNGRTLTTALRAAGGVRPDAALGTVYLIRGTSYAAIDMSTAITGGVAIDPQMAAGDRVIVPSLGCFQPDYVKPSAITQPGIRVYMSNLIRPAASNASAAIGKDSTNIPYGTRFLQGLVASNCVGGSMMNAQRHAVLISRNPINNHSVVVQRSIEQLVRGANRDDLDPYLMPGDAIACYDSTAQSISDVLGLAGGMVYPAVLAKGLAN